MKRIFTTLACVYLITSAWAATITLDGQVTDAATSEPLPGVSIVCKQTSSGTITDYDGMYSISVEEGQQLIFSYIGYDTKTITVTKGGTFNITLSEMSQEMDEVIVVGTAMKKSDLTGSIGVISADQISQAPTPNLNQALQGKVPGLYVEANPTPGQNATIKIRGNNSITYGTAPLYVIDNVMLEGTDISTIDPQNIASINVLKDASATAIYGARGANGVIVITTKKGQKGQLRVTYDGWAGAKQFAKTMPMLDGNQIFDLRVDAYANAYMDKNPTKDRQNYIEKYLTISGQRASRNVAFSELELEAHEQGMTYNWLDEITRVGVEHNHAATISGGTENGSYFASVGYNENYGQIVNSNYKRYSGKINVEQQVKSWLKFGTHNSLAYSIEKPSGTGSTFQTALCADPLLPVSKEYWYMQQGKLESQSLSNPLRDMYISAEYDKLRLLSSNFINISPLKGLDIRSTFSIDIAQQENDTYYPTNSTQSYKGSYDGQAVQYRTKSLNWQWDNTVNYSTIVQDRHRIDVTLGMNASYYSNNWNEVKAVGFGNDLFTFKNLGGAAKKEDCSLSSGYTSYSLMSVFLRANYVYDSRYYITFTGRGDGSSKFGPTHKWGFFPSVAASWNITGEEFMKQQNVVQNLRLRLGFGLAGNQNIPLYGYQTLYNPSATLESYVLLNSGSYGNPDLKWETQQQWNLGVDFATWKDRIHMNLDMFYTLNKDLLMQRSLAPSAGYSYRLDNVGTLENKGIEYSFDIDAIKTKDWNWSIGFNVATATNKIVELYDGVQEIYNLGGWSNNEIQRTGNLFVGESINSIYVYEFDRIIQEEDLPYVSTLDVGSRVVQPGDMLPKDRDGNKIINDADRYVVGNTDPKFYGGIHTELSWKGLALQVVANYSYGARRISGLYENLISSYGTSAAHADLANRWTPQNTDTNIPRAFSESGRFSVYELDWGIQDASFLKISTITLSYTFPKKWMNAIHFDNLRIYFTASNPFCFTPYKGWDPESGDGYPSSRMYVGGLNVSF